MTENVVVRLYDISVWCVATSTSPSTSGSKLQVVNSNICARVNFFHLTLQNTCFPPQHIAVVRCGGNIQVYIQYFIFTSHARDFIKVHTPLFVGAAERRSCPSSPS